MTGGLAARCPLSVDFEGTQLAKGCQCYSPVLDSELEVRRSIQKKHENCDWSCCFGASWPDGRRGARNG